MTTLTNPPLSTVLARLWTDAQASQEALRRERENHSLQERSVLKDSDYRSFYTRLKDFHLAVSRETGALLYALARGGRAQSIVEFGTSFAVSTLHLAAALRDNGGGRLITTEFEPSKIAQARANLIAAGVADLTEVREGDALQTLGRDLPESIDLVLLDGAKALYTNVLALLEPKLRTGAYVVADNADRCPEYLARVRSPAGDYLSVPLAGDVELSLKL